MARTKLRLWYFPGACSLASHMLLVEINANFELVLAEDRKFTPEFLAINPKGRVPVLALDDNTIVTENPAIMTAIANLAPEKKLLGSNPLETVRVYEWLNYLSRTIHETGFGACLRPERYTKDVGVHEALRAGGREILGEGYRFIDDKLSSSDKAYAVGDSMTVVDPFLFVLYGWGSTLLKIDMQREYPTYAALASRLSDRKSFREAMGTEKVELKL